MMRTAVTPASTGRERLSTGSPATLSKLIESSWCLGAGSRGPVATGAPVRVPWPLAAAGPGSKRAPGPGAPAGPGLAVAVLAGLSVAVAAGVMPGGATLAGATPAGAVLAGVGGSAWAVLSGCGV